MRHALAVVRANLKELRKTHTRAEVTILEKWLGLLHDNPRATAGDLSRVYGCSRQYANRILGQLQELGTLVRVGRTWFCFAKTVLNLETQGEIARRAYAKAREKKAKSENVNPPVTDIGTRVSVVVPDRQTALAELRETYVPPHLRRKRE